MASIKTGLTISIKEMEIAADLFPEIRNKGCSQSRAYEKIVQKKLAAGDNEGALETASKITDYLVRQRVATDIAEQSSKLKSGLRALCLMAEGDMRDKVCLTLIKRALIVNNIIEAKSLALKISNDQVRNIAYLDIINYDPKISNEPIISEITNSSDQFKAYQLILNKSLQDPEININALAAIAGRLQTLSGHSQGVLKVLPIVSAKDLDRAEAMAASVPNALERKQAYTIVLDKCEKNSRRAKRITSKINEMNSDKYRLFGRTLLLAGAVATVAVPLILLADRELLEQKARDFADQTAVLYRDVLAPQVSEAANWVLSGYQSLTDLDPSSARTFTMDLATAISRSCVESTKQVFNQLNSLFERL